MALADGRRVHVAHRRLREGARVAVLHLPGLVRLDVARTSDTFSFGVRNLRGGEQTDDAPFDGRTHRPRDGGEAMNEYDFAVGWVGGPRVRFVVRMPAYDGSLDTPCSVFAIVEERA